MNNEQGGWVTRTRLRYPVILVVTILLHAQPAVHAAEAEPQPQPQPDPPPPAAPREVPAPVSTYLQQNAAVTDERARAQAAVEAANKVVQADLATRQSAPVPAAADIDAEAKARTELATLQADSLKLQKNAQAFLDTINIPQDLDWLPEIRAARHAEIDARKAFNTFAPLAKAIADAKPTDLATVGVKAREMSAVSAQISALIAELHVQLGKAAETMLRLFVDSATLVVSGGVSLGSYQAGFLYYYTLHLKLWDQAIRKRFPDIQRSNEMGGRFRIATGASAGSVNAFLALVAGCREEVRKPEDSAFYRTWIDVGVSGASALANPDKVGVGSFFDKEALQNSIAVAAGMWTGGPAVVKKWTTEPCPSYLGVTATQVMPRYIQVSGGNAKGVMDAEVSVQRQPEKFLVMFDPAKPDAAAAPLLRSYRLGNDTLHNEVYPTLGTAPAGSTPENQTVKIGQLAGLLKASTSFPLAFAPEDLAFTVWKRRPDGNLVPTSSVGRFLDGGFLDNTPLRLALKITRKLGGSATNYLFLKSDAELWRAPERHVPLPIEPTGAQKKKMGVGSSSKEALPSSPVLPPSLQPLKEPSSLIDEYGPFLMAFLNGASDIELTEALLDMEDMTPSPQYWIPGRGMPIAGEYLAHFSAFLERSFRDFDFYQGMVDAYRHLISHSGRKEAADIEDVTVPVESTKFRCFVDYRKQLESATAAAVGPKLCKAPLTPPEPGPSCQGPGITKNLRALLKASASVRYWECDDRPGGDQWSVFLDALHEDGFTYDEFSHGDVLTSDEVAEKLRDKVQTLAMPLFHAQDDATGAAAASLIGKTASNFYHYRPASYWGLGVVAGLEVTHGLTLWRRHYAAIKIEPAVRIAQWVSGAHLAPASPGRESESYASMVSLPLVLEIPVNSVVQFEGGAGPGARVRWGVDGWDPKGWFHPLNARIGLDTQLSLVLLQHVYVSGGYTQYFDNCTHNNNCAGTFAAYKTAPDPIERDSHDFRLAVGWRFLY